METKKCSKCGKIKPLDEFYPNYDARRTVTRQSQCKDCVRARTAEYLRTHRPKSTRNKAEPLPDDVKKVCHSCGKELPLSSFYRKDNGILGASTNCKKCSRIMAAIYQDRYRKGITHTPMIKVGEAIGGTDEVNRIYRSKISDEDIYPKGFSYAN